MKRINILILALLVAGFSIAGLSDPAFAQAPKLNPADLRREIANLKLSPEELGKMDTMIEKNQEEMQKLKADVQILQAQIGRNMLEKSPSLEGLKKLVQQSMDLELKIRMIQIERHIKLGELLGADRAQAVIKLAKAINVLERSGKLPDKLADSEPKALLLKILKELM